MRERDVQSLSPVMKQDTNIYGAFYQRPPFAADFFFLFLIVSSSCLSIYSSPSLSPSPTFL